MTADWQALIDYALCDRLTIEQIHWTEPLATIGHLYALHHKAHGTKSVGRKGDPGKALKLLRKQKDNG